MNDRLQVNLIEKDVERKARRTTAAVVVIFTLFVGLFSALGAGFSYRASTRGTTILSEVGNFFVLSDLRRLVWGDEARAENDVLNTPDGRLNILLLGVGGAGHEGSQLTDTMMFASYDTATDRLGMVSIPRDMAFPLGGGRFQKINSLNAYSELEHPGEGAIRTAEALEKLLNVRIDRVVKIDFAGFAELIDAIGGVDINIETSFTDNSFPTDPKGPNPYLWKTVSFTKGLEHMDGTRALTYVRSRHGTNGEGSDFARSRRQQIVITAIRERLLSLGTLGNPKTVADIWNAISSHTETDLSTWDMLKLVPVAARFKTENVTTHVLSDGPKGELVPGTVDGAFMLFPRKPDWSDIRTLIADPFQTKEEIAKETRPEEPITVEIKNGTQRTGYAGQVSAHLEESGYVVASTGNAVRRGFERTVIYDLTNGEKATELARLKKMLDANVAVGVMNDKPSSSSTQFLIILGESSLTLLNDYVQPQNQ